MPRCKSLAYLQIRRNKVYWCAGICHQKKMRRVAVSPCPAFRVVPYQPVIEDSLESLSRSKGMTTHELKSLNHELDLTELDTSQSILVPQASSNPPTDKSAIDGYKNLIGEFSRGLVGSSRKSGFTSIMSKQSFTLFEYWCFTDIQKSCFWAYFACIKLLRRFWRLLPDPWSRLFLDNYITFGNIVCKMNESWIEEFFHRSGIPEKALNIWRISIIVQDPLSKEDRQILEHMIARKYRTYAVKEGETIESIISSRDISREEVEKLNPGSKLDSLETREVIKLPSHKYSSREEYELHGTLGMKIFKPGGWLANTLIAGKIVFETWIFPPKWDTRNKNEFGLWWGLEMWYTQSQHWIVSLVKKGGLWFGLLYPSESCCSWSKTEGKTELIFSLQKAIFLLGPRRAWSLCTEWLWVPKMLPALRHKSREDEGKTGPKRNTYKDFWTHCSNINYYLPIIWPHYTALLRIARLEVTRNIVSFANWRSCHDFVLLCRDLGNLVVLCVSLSCWKAPSTSLESCSTETSFQEEV